MSKYNFNIDIDNQESLFDKSKINSKSQKQTIEDFVIVDMGFATWSKYNLGVNPYILNEKKDWIGDLYGWGETVPNKKLYGWDTYTFFEKKFFTCYDVLKYNKKDGLEILEKVDDAAYITSKDSIIKMKIPSVDDFKKLVYYTDCKYIEDYNGIQNLSGILFISQINNAELFFPYNNDEIIELWTNRLKPPRDESQNPQLKSINDNRFFCAECFRMHNSINPIKIFNSFVSQNRWKGSLIRPIAMKIPKYEL